VARKKEAMASARSFSKGIELIYLNLIDKLNFDFATNTAVCLSLDELDG